MKEKIKKEWVEALRSGKYKKGRGYLNKNGKFCCLGVLTDLYIKKHKREKWIKEDRGVFHFKDGSYNEAYALPNAVRLWADIFPADPIIITKNEPLTLSALNDGNKHKQRKPLSFKQIAKLIEEQL